MPMSKNGANPGGSWSRGEGGRRAARGARTATPRRRGGGDDLNVEGRLTALTNLTCTPGMDGDGQRAGHRSRTGHAFASWRGARAEAGQSVGRRTRVRGGCRSVALTVWAPGGAVKRRTARDGDSQSIRRHRVGDGTRCCSPAWTCWRPGNGGCGGNWTARRATSCSTAGPRWRCESAIGSPSPSISSRPPGWTPPRCCGRCPLGPPYPQPLRSQPQGNTNECQGGKAAQGRALAPGRGGRGTYQPNDLPRRTPPRVGVTDTPSTERATGAGTHAHFVRSRTPTVVMPAPSPAAPAV